MSGRWRLARRRLARSSTMGTWSSALGVVLQDLGDLEGARVQLERALEISEAALGPDHPTLATFAAT